MQVTSSLGDAVTLETSPLSGDASLHLASVATEVGVPVPDDGVLQVRGGDTLKVQYIDDNTQAGQKDVARDKTVKVVSTGSATFTLGTFEGRAAAAFINQPLSVLVTDADRDTGDEADTLNVRVISRYKTEDEGLDDPIFRQPYVLPNGAPEVQPHSSNPRALGVYHPGQKRWMVFYHPGDLNDAWKDGASGFDRRVVKASYDTGINIIYHAFTQYLRLTKKDRK